MEIFKRRKGCQSFKIAGTESDVDAMSHGPLSPQVVEEGGELFEDFMSSQIDISLPQLRPLVMDRNPLPLKTAELSNAAAKLRQLATSFSQTDERRQVREMAMEISPAISGDQLGYLLRSMLTDNEHIEEGIVVIFFFCFDLAVRLLKAGLKSYLDMIQMCKAAIINALGPRIQAKGGWTLTIQTATNTTMAMGALATGMLVVARLGFRAFFRV